MIPNLDNTPTDHFPDVSQALPEPNGLLAIGGDLTAERVLAGYQRGIFPWFGIQDPILWWAPDPRAIFIPGQVHCSRRLKRKLRNHHFQVSLNQAFDQVIAACAAPRNGEPDTWLHAPMQMVYRQLHHMGYAYSMEVWGADNQLAGGIYGVALGKVFFAESMFSSQPDGSKVALLALSQYLHKEGFGMLDTQMLTRHLQSLGAFEIPRDDFLNRLGQLIP